MRKTPKKISRQSGEAAELKTYYVAPCRKGDVLMAHTSDRSRANSKCASTPCAALGEVLARSMLGHVPRNISQACITRFVLARGHLSSRLTNLPLC
jgi:hypothetical protein